MRVWEHLNLRDGRWADGILSGAHSTRTFSLWESETSIVGKSVVAGCRLWAQGDLSDKHGSDNILDIGEDVGSDRIEVKPTAVDPLFLCVTDSSVSSQPTVCLFFFFFPPRTPSAQQVVVQTIFFKHHTRIELFVRSQFRHPPT